MDNHAAAGRSAGQVEDDPIDVVRIRLSTPANAIALLSEYRSADRVVARWASQSGFDPVEFEITFAGGRVMRGRYALVERGKRARSFSAHVRRLLGAVPAPCDPAPRRDRPS